MPSWLDVGANARIQRRQIERAHDGLDGTHRVVAGDAIVEREAHLGLLSLCTQHEGIDARRRRRRRPRRRAEIKQYSLRIHCQ
jgi:hypothetical protein